MFERELSRKAQFCSRDCSFTWHRLNTPPIKERFWLKVQKTDACWLWIGGRNASTQGRFAYSKTRVGLASRYSWELHYGAIPEGLEVCHRCDTPACVRPDHLFLGTHLDNMRDSVAKGRNYTPKLSAEKVREIRERFAHGESKNSLSKAYGVARSVIRGVVNQTLWRHVSL
jgi:hypothetical protein